LKILFIQSTPYVNRTTLVKKSRLYFVGLAPAILAALVPDVAFEVCLETIEDVNFESDADLIATSGAQSRRGRRSHQVYGARRARR